VWKTLRSPGPARRGDAHRDLFIVCCPPGGQRLEAGALNVDALGIVRIDPPHGVIDETTIGRKISIASLGYVPEDYSASLEVSATPTTSCHC